MNMLKELLRIVFGERENEDPTLNARIEFRLNRNEKTLIKKYCDLKNISISEFLRYSATKEIDTFLRANN